MLSGWLLKFIVIFLNIIVGAYLSTSFVLLFLITTFAFMRKLLSALSQIMLNPNRGKIAAGNASGSNEVVNPLEDQRGTEVHTGRAEDGQN